MLHSNVKEPGCFLLQIRVYENPIQLTNNLDSMGQSLDLSVASGKRLQFANLKMAIEIVDIDPLRMMFQIFWYVDQRVPASTQE